MFVYVRAAENQMITNIVVVFSLSLSKWLTVDGTPGPVGPTAGRIVNTTVVVRAPALRLQMEANIASAVI